MGLKREDVSGFDTSLMRFDSPVLTAVELIRMSLKAVMRDCSIEDDKKE